MKIGSICVAIILGLIAISGMIQGRAPMREADTLRPNNFDAELPFNESVPFTRPKREIDFSLNDTTTNPLSYLREIPKAEENSGGDNLKVEEGAQNDVAGALDANNTINMDDVTRALDANNTINMDDVTRALDANNTINMDDVTRALDANNTISTNDATGVLNAYELLVNELLNRHLSPQMIGPPLPFRRTIERLTNNLSLIITKINGFEINRIEDERQEKNQFWMNYSV